MEEINVNNVIPTKLLIREIEEEDIPEVAKLHISSWQTAYKNIINQEYLDNMSVEERIKKYKAKFTKGKYGKANFIVAQKEHEIVGFCRYGERIDELDRFKDYDGEIVALYVKSNNLRQGIGKEILNYAMQDMKNKGKQKVIIWCLKENYSSRKFYEKIGGRLLGEKEVIIGNNKYLEVAYGYQI